jgi:ferric-dicitrate binding protein FerR (iron transport regulator)
MGESTTGIETLVDALIEGRCDEAGLRRLETLVRDDPKARDAYLDQMRMHALLEWRHGLVAPGLETSKASTRRMGRPALGLTLGGLAAAAALIGAAVVWSAVRPAGSADAVATLVHARDVAWGESTRPVAPGTRLAPGAIRFDSGTVRLAFDRGATVDVEGPAEVDVVSGMRIRALRGRLTARVDGGAKGFTVETPNTRVVDQGTEFGVEVDSHGRTGVVVFEGLVDLAPPGPDAAVRRLERGEAVAVDPAGRVTRIVRVERRPRGGPWTTGPSPGGAAVIRSVRDNIRGLESAKFYQVVPGGLHEDAPAYVDRVHEWNGLDDSGLPPFLVGADYVMTFNEDKWTPGLEITVDLARAADLYVLLDRRETPPAWLRSEFRDTGAVVGLDEESWPDPTLFGVDRGAGRSINQRFSVWARRVDGPGPVRLGSLEGGRNNRSMYGVAAVPRP